MRGFSYQAAGPRDAFNNPLGGASIVESSVEFRQRIGKSFGIVAFVDAGAAFENEGADAWFAEGAFHWVESRSLEPPVR